MFEKLQSVDVFIVITISILHLRLPLYSKLQVTYRYNDKNIHSIESYLDNVAPLCIFSSKLRVVINTPFLPADYGMV